MSDPWRILIVEDEPDGQEVLRSLLERANIDSVAARTGEEALMLLEREVFTAVVIDLMLPGIDGFEVLRNIRSLPQGHDLPCVAVTAYHTSAVKQQALRNGFNGYFPKPFEPRTFVQQLKQLID